MISQSGLTSACSSEFLLEPAELHPRERDRMNPRGISASPTCSNVADPMLGFRGLGPSEPHAACSDEVDHHSNIP